MAIFPAIVYILLIIMQIAFFLRFIMWIIGMIVPPLMDSGFSRFLASMTEPIISPFRTLVPEIRGIDLFSFVFAYIMLQIMTSFVGGLAGIRLF